MRPHTSRPELTAELLRAAYRSGFFPMVGRHGAIEWHRPDPRAIFELGRIAPPDRATRRLLERAEITTDTAFEEVMRRCASREETWIDARMIAAYAELHRLGYAHSLEVRLQGALVGGIYGVRLGAAFFGESLFGTNNAGKAAFHALVARLRAGRFMLFDTQYINPFTERLGAVEVPLDTFLARLDEALGTEAVF
jgi:leucyl/phenylalanyl-tRNA--protein transferase